MDLLFEDLMKYPISRGDNFDAQSCVEDDIKTAGETFHDGDLLLNIKGWSYSYPQQGTHKAATGHHPGCICVALGRIVSSSRPQQGCNMLLQATIQAATGHQFETAVGLHQTAAYNHPNKSFEIKFMVSLAIDKFIHIKSFSLMQEICELCYQVGEDDVICAQNQLKSLLLLHIEALLLLKTLDDMYSGY
ncbi:hypothetical protein R6Q59_027640 [Mikania micrantha]